MTDVDSSSFEVTVQLPPDARLVGAICDLARHAARYSGCGSADTDAFGSVVHEVVQACLGGPSRSVRESALRSSVSVVLRRQHGPVELLIDSDRLFEPGAVENVRISVGWTEERGRRLCRIALSSR